MQCADSLLAFHRLLFGVFSQRRVMLKLYGHVVIATGQHMRSDLLVHEMLVFLLLLPSSSSSVAFLHVLYTMTCCRGSQISDDTCH